MPKFTQLTKGRTKTQTRIFEFKSSPLLMLNSFIQPIFNEHLYVQEHFLVAGETNGRKTEPSLIEYVSIGRKQLIIELQR